MHPPRSSALLLIVLLGACAVPAVRVDREQGFDGGWTTAEGTTQLDATGQTVTLRFQGRTFLFPRMKEFRGFLSDEAVELNGDLLVQIDLEEVRVVDKQREQTVREVLAHVPPGATIRYVSGRFVTE